MAKAEKKVAFMGDPMFPKANGKGEGPKRITVHGVDFIKGQFRDVSDVTFRKLVKHPHFQTEGDEWPKNFNDMPEEDVEPADENPQVTASELAEEEDEAEEEE